MSARSRVNSALVKKQTFLSHMRYVLLPPLLLESLAPRPWLMAPTLRLMTALFQIPDLSPLDDTIYDHPQDTSLL